jgi:molecular chaperone GrpE
MLEPPELVQKPEQEEHSDDTLVETSSPVLDIDEPISSHNFDQAMLQPILMQLQQLEQTVARLSMEIGQLSEQVSLIPRQVRQLGTKVDDTTQSISHPRIRDLLNSVLLLYDLVDQMQRANQSDHSSPENYQVLQEQIGQILRVNGISLIEEAKCFDPAIHKAVETVPCQILEEDGEITQIHRPGFRTERAILRYAEVIVKRYQRPD